MYFNTVDIMLPLSRCHKFSAVKIEEDIVILLQPLKCSIQYYFFCALQTVQAFCKPAVEYDLDIKV